MHTFTFYDSAYTHKNPNLSPVHHLRCDLKMCKESENLLTESNVVQDITKFPTSLHCVLTDIPEISFSSRWDKGATTHMFEPITNFIKDSPIGKAVQLFAYDNYIPMVPTNEYSQQVMKEGSRIQLRLKFTIYTDTYNKRYNFSSTPYETWLRMLYFSTAPIYRATYANLYNNLRAAVKNVADQSEAIIKLGNTLKDSGAVLMNSLPFVEKDPNEAAKINNIIANMEELSQMLMKYLTKADMIGHVCWDVSIPNYIYSTNNTSSPVLWNIKNFNVKFSDKFTRGTLNTKDAKVFRPRPLFADFEVTLESNQIMTRDQYIKLLFGNIYNNLLSKKAREKEQKDAS